MNRWIGLGLGLAFCGTLRASPPEGLLALDAGAPHILWEEAGKHVGETCYVYGRIVATGSSASWCFLNYHEDYRNHFCVAIARHNLGRFPEPPERFYKDKIVRVFGKIVEYQSRPEIKVASPDQIAVLDKLPTAEELAALQPQVVYVCGFAFDPPDDGVLVIASYNVENLFDTQDDPYTEDEHTPPKSREEMDKLAKTIRELNADVLALQEVENLGYLQRFVGTLLWDRGYKEIVLVEGNDERGIDVALLSRIPVGEVISHRHARFKDPKGEERRFERDALQVRLEPVCGEPFDVFVLHLKSKYGGETEETQAIRVAEAGAVRRMADELLSADPQSRFVVCGDLNDTIDSAAIRTIQGEGSGRLACFADQLPPDQRVSYRIEPYQSMIDYIFCSPAMAARYRPASYRIVQVADGASGSDHNPVIASFEWTCPAMGTPSPP